MVSDTAVGDAGVRGGHTLLPHALAALYALAIVYASLQPFGDWIAPPEGTPFWLFSPGAMRWPRYDVIANVIAYLPLGAFVALVPRRASPRRRRRNSTPRYWSASSTRRCSCSTPRNTASAPMMRW